jgi:hypothetical protein
MLTNKTKMNKNSLPAILMSMITLSAMTMLTVLNKSAQATPYESVVVCETAPCVLTPGAFQSGNNIIFRWHGLGDFYHVRYPVRGGEKQVKNRSGSFTFTNVQPDRIYRISVQACNSRFLRSSVCTPWEETSFTTR